MYLMSFGFFVFPCRQVFLCLRITCVEKRKKNTMNENCMKLILGEMVQINQNDWIPKNVLMTICALMIRLPVVFGASHLFMTRGCKVTIYGQVKFKVRNAQGFLDNFGVPMLSSNHPKLHVISPFEGWPCWDVFFNHLVFSTLEICPCRMSHA